MHRLVYYLTNRKQLQFFYNYFSCAKLLLLTASIVLPPPLASRHVPLGPRIPCLEPLQYVESKSAALQRYLQPDCTKSWWVVFVYCYCWRVQSSVAAGIVSFPCLTTTVCDALRCRCFPVSGSLGILCRCVLTLDVAINLNNNRDLLTLVQTDCRCTLAFAGG